MEEENIYPIFDRMLSRKDKEELLGQRGVMLWLTGLSGSGKSTIAIALELELHKRGLLCRILDGDNIRSGINNNLGFSQAQVYFALKVFLQLALVSFADGRLKIMRGEKSDLKNSAIYNAVMKMQTGQE